MKNRIAIVGGGIAAGLSAIFFSDKNEIDLYSPPNAKFSPIPEIVPHAVLNDFLDMYVGNATQIINSSKPNLLTVNWRHQGHFDSRKLSSVDRYVVYDKGRLAGNLISRSKISSVHSGYVENIETIRGYECVLDCRGHEAISKDPSYSSSVVGEAKTKCSYVIADKPNDVTSNTMYYWSHDANHVSADLFLVPIGNNRVSIGCSYTPDKTFTHAELFDMASCHGIFFTSEKIHFKSFAEPVVETSKVKLSNVVPIGESASTSCPLTEYGAVKVLKQLSAIRSNMDIDFNYCRPQFSNVVDPHIPSEIFA